MPRRPAVPLELTRGPFTVAQARRAGLWRWHLEGKSWRRVGPRIYAWVGLVDTPILKLEAAHLSMPPGAAFSGRTAAWLHGLDVSPCEPIEMILPSAADGLGRNGVLVHRVALDDSEVEVKRGFRTTSLLRTIFDFSWKLSLVEAVVIADMALHAGMVRHAELTEWIECRAGVKGVKSARRVLELADPASESPMETRLRLLLVLGGLPRPEAQVRLHDDQGRFLGRPDLFYPDHRLGLEYDGTTHRTSLADDNRRQNRLLAAGIRLLRFTAGDLLNSPEAVVTQVRGMLSTRFTR